MKKNITIITALTISIMLLAANAFADIPAPPVNQSVGMPDGIMNDLDEMHCRACHDQPGPDNSMSNSARHHLLYDTPIIYGECSVNRNACLTDADCAAIEVCVGETAASNPSANTSIYDCLSCHDQVTIAGATNFIVQSNCLYECHYQVPGEASVHHLTGIA